MWDKHHLALTESGVEHWQSFVKFNKSYEPPIRQLSDLTAKEFVMTIDGVEMYRGHFWSRVSSAMTPGVKLYDTSGVPNDKLWIGFTRVDGETTQDPRSRPEIEAYFQKQRKLNTD